MRFDNVLKTRAIYRDPEDPLPLMRADAYFANFLESGTGGTCWPHGNALYTWLEHLGFDARRATASMFDFGEPNHSTTLVHFEDGSTWLVDNALLTMEPLRIDPEAPSLFNGGVHYAEVEIDGDQVFVHGTNPPMPHIFFRLLDRDVTEDQYVENWESYRRMGPFNAGIHIRRNFEDRIQVLRGNGLFTLTSEGPLREQLDAEGIKRHLVETMGIAEKLVEDWAKSGALEASLKPSEGMPPLPERTPPSRQRQL